MPKFNCILNLPGFSVLKVSGYQPLLFDVKYTRKPRCGHCDGRQVRIKDSFIRTVKHEAIAERRVLLRFKAYKLFCHHCQCYSNQRFPGIQKHQRSTQRLHKQIFHLHTDGLSQKTLAKQFKVGKATVERWYHQQYELARKKIDVPHCPTVLGIDEHSFSRKQGFATTLCDLRKHKIFDVVPGKSEPDLNTYLNQLQGKDKVRVICMDLSTTYRSIAKTHFPNAKIVADRFHVIRLMHHHAMQTYRTIDQTIKHNRGILAVLRKKPDRLTEKQRQRRDDYLEKHPAIKHIYLFKQKLYQLLMVKSVTKQKAIQLIPQFLETIHELKNSPFKHLNTLGKTLESWQEEIVCMWRFTKNNGITEGFHRKMKLIQRRAYGFRNFQNYRLRVRVLCGSG